jgi:hypothetical protein
MGASYSAVLDTRQTVISPSLGQPAPTEGPLLPRATGSVEQPQFDYVRLLRQVPAITELVQLGAQILTGLHLVAFTCIILKQVVQLQTSP